jgi:hypothetical protein
MTDKEYVQRFVAHMVSIVGKREDMDVRGYAEGVAASYMVDFPDLSPEAAAEGDVSYWEEE